MQTKSKQETNRKATKKSEKNKIIEKEMQKNKNVEKGKPAKNAKFARKAKKCIRKI